MRKITLTLLMGFVLSVVTFGQQDQHYTITEDQSGSRGAGDLTCPVNSVFSQTPNGSSGFLPNYGVVIYDNIPTTLGVPVGSFTIWGTEQEGPVCTPTFDIFIREDNAGTPGALIASYTNLAIPGVNTGETFGGGIIYSYTFNFPVPLTIQSGDWIGFANYQGTSTCRGYLVSTDGDNHSIAFVPDIGFIPIAQDFSFCLGPVPPATPISGWAIGLGVFLIVAVTLIRMKRI
jgi:hypothetical protein